MFYRFPVDTFIKATTFKEAKKKLIDKINKIEEDEEQWSSCTCLGFYHKNNCPEWVLPL